MNAQFEELAQALGIGDRAGALVDALYVLRAPKSLTGIIPMAREFRDWRAQFPGLNALDVISNYRQCLELLDRIADLECEDETLTGEILARRAHSLSTPCRPYTGDSVIGELLLIRAQSEHYSDAFRCIGAWLVWQVQRFHVKGINREVYKQYLLEDGPRLLEQGQGTRIYNAYLEVRKMADSSLQDQLLAFQGLDPELSRERSLVLTLLARLTRLSDGAEARRLRRYATASLDINESRLQASVEAVEHAMPAALSLLLTTVWGNELNLRVGVRRSGGGGGGKRVVRPQLRRGKHLTEMLLRADEDDVHAGTVIDFFSRDDGHHLGHDDRKEVDDDPEEEEQREPAFSLFLADSDDPIKGYYGAKATQNAIEYQNAQLPWAKFVLSREALNILIATILRTDETRDGLMRNHARLAVGLSLLTGRALEEVALPEIGAGACEVSEDAPVVIDRRRYRMHVLCGRPELRREAAPPRVCYSSAHSISLPLPFSWRQLVDAVSIDRSNKRTAVVRSARQLLRSLDKHFRVTEKGVRYAFIRALAESTRGDLGAQKAITDGTEANTQNVIHYASYSASELEKWWRLAAETVLGEALPEETSAVSGRADDARIGSQHAFDIRALAEYISDIKKRIEAAQRKGEWIRFYNLMTLYLAYWLGIGTAGRKTRYPVPRIMLAGGWALVSDKHRPDGSTDRMVPLTDALRSQIDAYLGLASELAILLPEIDPLVETDRGPEIRLRYIQHDGAVVPYQPKYQEDDEQLTTLPANFGRKIFRSESEELPGRYRDAELGHFVRGRHAWHVVSTVNAPDLRVKLLARQAQLEQQLGFALLTLGAEQLISRQPPKFPARTRRSKKSSQRQGESSRVIAIESMLEAASPDHYRQLMDQSQPCDQNVALELVRRLVSSHSIETNERLLELAKSACKFIRQQRKIPLFAERPRPLFANRVVLDAAGLQTLDYLQTYVLDAFHADLANLPAWTVGTTESSNVKANRQELGRLVMIGIWRLGLCRWSLIDAWLGALHADTPILAAGEARYLIFQVMSEISRQPMQRTVCLDAFSSSYLTIERARIRDYLLIELYGRTSAVSRVSRRARVESAINCYLEAIGAGRYRVTLSAMTEAATQQIMCESAPVIAAYSSGELMTDDLGDADLRRLAGFDPARRRADGVEERLLATKEHDDLGEAEIPNDVVACGSRLLNALLGRKYSGPDEWQDAIRNNDAETPPERLLRAFALWLIARDDASGDNAWERYGRRYLRNRLQVVASMLLGYATSDAEWNYIDEGVLVSLAEISREHFPDRIQHGAWFQFHRFLSDKDADHGGFKIGRLGPPPVRAVSAKILGQDEMEHVLTLLLSAKSGIGNASLRVSARHHVELMSNYGLRRAESAALRGEDYQYNLVRVQAYGEHSLKTAWADRTLPLAFAEPATREWMRQARVRSFGLLIDPDESTTANPDSFFDAVNQVIKQVSGDESLTSHHLRHTLASRLTMTLLKDAVNLAGITGEFPWAGELPIDDDRMAGLLGSEGNAGQGIQALAGLIGHSHATTSIRHYVHILFLALYAALRKVDRLDICRSFETRVASRATVQRWARAARDSVGADAPGQYRDAINQQLRDRVELRMAYAGIDRDDTRKQTDRAPPDEKLEVSENEHLDFDFLESVDRSLRGDTSLTAPAEVVERSRHGMARLAELVTDKRGSRAARHELESIGDGMWVPPRLAAGTATKAAAGLCDWLRKLKSHQPSDYQWLLKKWVFASSRDRGYIRLDDSADENWAHRIADPARVALQLTKQPGSVRKRARMKCIGRDGELIVRDTVAVRWVMSHVAAIEYSALEAVSCPDSMHC